MSIFIKAIRRQAMHQYPKMLSQLYKYYSTEDNEHLKQIGRNCIEALTYQILFENKLEIINKELLSSMANVITYELNLNHGQQILYYFSNQIFISQIKEARDIAKETIKKIIDKYNCSTAILPKQQRKKNIDNHSEESVLSENSMYKQQVSEVNEQDLAPKQGSFLQNYQLKSLKEGRIEEECKALIKYITNLTCPKTQISQFCQQMKIPFPIYQKTNEDKIYHVRAVFQMQNHYTSYNQRRFQSFAKFASLKRAENQAALEILEKVWRMYPILWKDYMSIKKKKQMQKKNSKLMQFNE